ncbi:MAG: Hsp70 family protein [Gemmataceae bacterium]
MARYLIGIDLGTTNSALAYVDLRDKPKDGKPVVRPFPVTQLVAPGETAPRPLLPSFLYLPGEHDLPPGAAALPWNDTAREIVGEFARQHGSRVPGRLVASAKSWLSHAGVDRAAALLPWGAPPDVPRLSPLDVSARYLRHLADAWNHTHAADERLEAQPVVLTVPASFDDVARNLTVEAAKKAGLTNITLIEEPQAAFYAWLATSPAGEAADLMPGMRCLVVDVGGGTSDFSLIACAEERGELAFVREAVGDHLLLGGDNMDLALARAAEAKLGGAKLDAAQFGQLVQACRAAKETLLGPTPPTSVPVTVVGRGRSVVGGTLTATLTGDEVRGVLFDGFFPAAAATDEPQKPARAGLHEMGLPYVHDPAVTRHLAAFLKNQSPASPPTAVGGTAVDAILFNGGVFQPAALRSRLVDVMRAWSPAGWEPLVLTTPSLDLAVAWGAAAYAWLRHTGGRRIGGGTARSYYVGVHRDDPPTAGGGLSVVCVVPRRLEEDREIVLDGPDLELTLGEPASFPLFTSTVRDDKPGQVLHVAPDQLQPLPPLTTVLRAGKKGGGTPKQVPVTLAAKSTAVGTLELYCVAKDKSARWRLEFNTRDVVRPQEAVEAEEAHPWQRVGATDVLPEDLVQTGVECLRAVYADGGGDPRELTKALEAALDMPRYDWPTGLCRRLADALVELADGRSRSPAHRGRWFNLLGYLLRPGFGDPLDRFRVDGLWKLLNAPKPGGGPPQPEGGADVWILWRRVAGGLSAAQQQTLFERVRPALLGKGKAVAKPGANELAEMWRAAASLERLDPTPKQLLGDALLKQLKRSPTPTYAFWSLTRLGARVLLYGPLNGVLHPDVVGGWLDQLVGFTPGHEGEARDFAFCLAELARMSGQRALDIDDSRRSAVLTVLKGMSIPAEWRRMVAEVVAETAAESSRLFGESLPIGLRLRG